MIECSQKRQHRFRRCCLSFTTQKAANANNMQSSLCAIYILV